MGDLKVAEVFQDAVFITDNATGLGQGGLAPTCTFIKIADNTRTAGTVQEVGNGWYRVTDFQADAVGAWTTEWAVVGAFTIHLAAKIFKAGGGRIEDIIAALGTDGTTLTSYDYNQLSAMQYIHGQHRIAIILFVIPEAAIGTDNTALQTELEKMGEVVTITQDDALTYPEFSAVSLCVLGTTTDGTPWTTAKLAHLKTVPNLPIICVDKVAAAYLELGTDGGDAAAKTAITAVANIKGSILGAGYRDTTGLAAGANTVSSAAIYHTLDMSGADITEVWFASESVGNNTDVVLGLIPHTLPDGTPGIDEEDLPVDATMAFYGCGYEFAKLNTLGKATFQLLCERIIHEQTIGLPVAIASLLEDIQKKLFGNVRGKLSNTVPMAAFLVGNSGGAGTELPNNISLYDVVKHTQNSELFGSVMLEEVQLGVGAADVNMPNVDLPDIPGTIDRVYLHFKVRMIENTYDGANMLAGAQSIRIKKAAGAWGVDDIPAITFLDDGIALAALTREAGDVFGGKIDISSEVDAFNATYNIRWEDGAVDFDFINFNDIEMFLRVIFH